MDNIPLMKNWNPCTGVKPRRRSVILVYLISLGSSLIGCLSREVRNCLFVSPWTQYYCNNCRLRPEPFEARTLPTPMPTVGSLNSSLGCQLGSPNFPSVPNVGLWFPQSINCGVSWVPRWVSTGGLCVHLDSSVNGDVRIPPTNRNYQKLAAEWMGREEKLPQASFCQVVK